MGDDFGGICVSVLLDERRGNDAGKGADVVGIGAGLALLAGRVGNFVINTSIAQRIGSPLPSSGEPDRSPRFWLTTQKWF